MTKASCWTCRKLGIITMAEQRILNGEIMMTSMSSFGNLGTYPGANARFKEAEFSFKTFPLAPGS